ncbi:unnamed protein product [Orchesella dallaii]|uniref:Uncharacterized protein n=1 Tax=Orchesella dallaii TaxID=48710 RepID=A0ABP1RPL5_9HEXA
MGFSKACSQVLRLLQIYYPIPYSIQPGIIVVTNKSGKKSKLWKILWKSTKYFAAFGMILFLWRLQVLFQTWKNNRDLEQLGILVAGFSIIMCGYSTIQMLETHGNSFIYLVAQYLTQTELNKQKDLIRPKTLRRHPNRWIRPSMKEVLIYELSFVSVTTYPLVVSAVPLLRNYDPLVKLFSTEFASDPTNPSLLTKIFASLIYFKVIMHTAPLFLVVLLASMVCLDSTLQMSRQLQLLVNKPTMSVSKVRFKQLLMQYRILELLTSLGRLCTGDYLANLVVIGVIQASGLGYITLMYYKLLPFMLYLASVCITLAVFTIIFLLVTLASIPYKNGEAFKLGCKRNMFLCRRERACNKVQRYLQLFFPVPYSIQPGILVVTNESAERSTLYQILCNCTKSFMGFAIILILWRIHALNKSWEKHEDLEQLGMVVAMLAIMVCVYSMFQMMDTHKKAFVYLMSQILKCQEFESHENLRRRTQAESHRRIKLLFEDILVYELSIVFVTAYPLLLSILPLMRNYEPIVTLLSILFTEDGTKVCLTIKIFSSVSYLLAAMHAAPVFLSLLLAAVVVGEATLRMSYQLQLIVNRRVESISKVRFRQLIRQYRILQLLIAAVREISRDFLFIVAVCAVTEASCFGYISILCYNQLPFIFYIASAFLTMAIFIVGCILITLASTPYRNCAYFKLGYTRNILLSKKERYELRACPDIGFSFGFVSIAKEKLAIELLNIVLNNIASIALLGSFKRLKS